MIQIYPRKPELQAENRRYRPKIGDTGQNRPQIRTESPGKVPERVSSLSAEKGLKASLNPVKILDLIPQANSKLYPASTACRIIETSFALKILLTPRPSPPKLGLRPLLRCSALLRDQCLKESRLAGRTLRWGRSQQTRKHLLGLRNARPATRIRNPQNPKFLEKNSKITPRTPNPNSLKKTRKILKTPEK